MRKIRNVTKAETTAINSTVTKRLLRNSSSNLKTKALQSSIINSSINPNSNSSIAVVALNKSPVKVTAKIKPIKRLTKGRPPNTVTITTSKIINRKGPKTADRQINQKTLSPNNNKQSKVISSCKTRSKNINLSNENVVMVIKSEDKDDGVGSTNKINSSAGIGIGMDNRNSQFKITTPATIKRTAATTKTVIPTPTAINVEPNKTKTQIKTITTTSKPTTNATSTSTETEIDTESENKSKIRRKKRIKRKYLCQICDKEFSGGNDLRKHIRIHTGERPFACQHCDKRFRQGGCLKNHIASQHGTTQTFICHYCNKSFPIKERLRLHMRLHSGEKPYRCDTCGKQFARGGQLTQHMVTHNGMKKYQCTQCSAAFSCSMNLKLHLKGHSNVRDFTCHLCEKAFTRPDALRKHLTCFHENVKAFFCNICSRTFKGHLPQHMRTHNNIKAHGCAYCGATFSQKSQLIVHHRIHSGERPYRCQVCWQSFAHSSVLKLHIRKHTGEKPFACMVCTDTETAFSQLPHLKTHMRAIHGMDKAYKCDGCTDFFKTKHELMEHRIKCAKFIQQNGTDRLDSTTETQQSNQLMHTDSTRMSLSKMRLLVAVLLKKISTQERLRRLGFDKRLIDNVLIDALQMAEQPICNDIKFSEIERLRVNVKQFLEWTVPDAYMKKFKREQRNTEELLEDLTSSFRMDSNQKDKDKDKEKDKGKEKHKVKT